LRHLHRETPCNDDLNCEKTAREIQDSTLASAVSTCDACSRMFKTHTDCLRHAKFCSGRRRAMACGDGIDATTTTTIDSHDTTTIHNNVDSHNSSTVDSHDNTTTTNDSHDNTTHTTTNDSHDSINITNNVTINNFGEEKYSYVTSQIMLECLDVMKVVKLIQEIYFHPDHPENHTINLKSEKKGRVIVRKDGKEVEDDMNSSIDSMIEKGNQEMNAFFYQNVFPDEKIDFEKRAYTQQKLANVNNRNPNFFNQRRSIKATMKNIKDQKDAATKK
jgi:hypothetical protein